MSLRDATTGVLLSSLECMAAVLLDDVEQRLDSCSPLRRAGVLHAVAVAQVQTYDEMPRLALAGA